MAGTTYSKFFWADSGALHLGLIDDGWRTPDTYSAHFDDPPPSPAVYLLTIHHPREGNLALVAYVGMSTNLAARLQGHEVLQKLRKAGFYTQRWFKAEMADRLRDAERCLIKRFDPPWNLIGRPLPEFTS